MRTVDFADGFTSSSAPTDTSNSQSLSNNVSATSLTGALLSSSTHRGAIVEVEIKRKTDSSERRSFIMLKTNYKESATAGWYITAHDEDVMTGSAASGVTLTITTAGQIQYATDNHTGANYAATGKWKWVRRYA